MITPLKISLGFSVSFFILLVGLFLRHCRTWKINKIIEDYVDNAQLKKELVKYNGSAMLATREFTPYEIMEAISSFDSVIDTGEHGEVYKGNLKDGRVVAVKMFKSEESTVRNMYVREVSLLSRINHRHLLRLLGYCIRWRQQTLVYDFINNGTLYEHIDKNSSQGSPALSLKLRMKIAAEIAAALAYLHSSSSSSSKPSVIHLNVNSKRILLDDNYTARLSYFRDAKLVPEGQTQIEGTTQGSPGYLDPEQSNKLSEKNDIYSFGVVLVELLTSQKAHSPEKPEEERDLAKLFTRSMEERRLHQILDGEIIEENLIETAEKVAHLAKSCLGSRNGRPSMKEVAMKLEVIRFMAWHYSAAKGMANLNVSRSPKETDYLLGSPSKAQVLDVRRELYDDFGSSGLVSSAELFNCNMENHIIQF